MPLICSIHSQIPDYNMFHSRMFCPNVHINRLFQLCSGEFDPCKDAHMDNLSLGLLKSMLSALTTVSERLSDTAMDSS